jgi:tRNA G26 N,N-dimethylase Trm1
MTPTPQTDARELAVSIQNEDSCCAIYVKIDGKEYEGGLVDTDFARELERENAELRTDGQRWQNEHLRLLAENAELLAANAELITVGAELSATADELRAENAELREDKARGQN